MNLLLHMCCGPCSCYPVKVLREQGIEPTGYFFNPNIHPYKEWDMRLKAAEEFAARSEMKIITDKHYMLRDFLRRALAAEQVEKAIAMTAANIPRSLLLLYLSTCLCLQSCPFLGLVGLFSRLSQLPAVAFLLAEDTAAVRLAI